MSKSIANERLDEEPLVRRRVRCATWSRVRVVPTSPLTRTNVYGPHDSTVCTNSVGSSAANKCSEMGRGKDGAGEQFSAEHCGGPFSLVPFPLARRHRRTNFRTAPIASCRLSEGDEISMIGHLCRISEFVRRVKIQARFGELFRAPLQLLRLELRKGIVECD